MKLRNSLLPFVLLTLQLLWISLTYCAAKVGDIAQGVIVKEDERGLILQTDPCDPDSPIITFSAPWKKTSVRKKKCSNNKSYEVFQIEQLASAPNPGQDKRKNKNDKEEQPGEAAPKPSADEVDRKPPNQWFRR